MVLHVLRLAVRRESHQLVFAGVHLEAGEVGERGIQQSERVREPQLAEDVELVAAADADRRGGPFADAVDRQHRRLLERRRIERRRRVRLVMFAEQDLARVARRDAPAISSASHSLLPSQSGIAMMYERSPRGAEAT